MCMGTERKPAWPECGKERGDGMRRSEARSDRSVWILFYFFKIYLFIHEREREREAEGEAGSLQRAPCGTQCWILRSQTETKADPQLLSHPGIPSLDFILTTVRIYGV